MPKRGQFDFSKRMVLGQISSRTVVEARESLYDELLEFGVKAIKEAEEIEAVADELEGDPWASSRYAQAMELAEILQRLKKLLDNTLPRKDPIRKAREHAAEG